jgi:hypothetical protein
MVIIQYQTHPDSADVNQKLIEQVFAELKAASPDGMRYTTFRLADGVSFVHIVEGDSAPLTELPAFVAFQEGASERMAVPPTRSEATVIGSYPS